MNSTVRGPARARGIRFAGMEKTARVDAAGAWNVTLDPPEASTENRDLTVDYADKNSGHGRFVRTAAWACNSLKKRPAA